MTLIRYNIVDKIYIVAGIKGMPLKPDRSIFSVDKIIVRDLISAYDIEFTVDEIVDNNIFILGLPSWILEDYNSYNACKRSFVGSGEDYVNCYLPLYYSNNTNKMPCYEYDSKSDNLVYIGDKDARCSEDEIIGASLSVGRIDKSDGYSTCDIYFDIFMPLGGGFHTGIRFKKYGEFVDAKDDEYDLMPYKYECVCDDGNILDNIKYFTCLCGDIYGNLLEELQKSGIATLIYGACGRITELVTDKMHIVDFYKMSKDTTIITSDSCRVFVFGDYGATDGCSLVLNPNITKIVNDCFFYYSAYLGSLETSNIKLFISRRMQIGVILDFVKSVRFKGYKDSCVIGFGEFRDYSKKARYRKCCEITDILDSNDTSHRLFNDIEYLVSELNQIGFNIEIY